MNLGIHDISNEHYHASEGISRSMVMQFRKSPKHYWYKYLSGIKHEEKPTEAMIFGEAIHTWLLEHDKRWDKYHVGGDFDKRTKDGKLAYINDQMQANGKILITSAMQKELDMIANQVKEYPMVFQLIGNSEYEKSIYWIDEDTGLLCKCRPDIWSLNYVADLKTTKSADYDSFQRSVAAFGYDIQAAMIVEGIKHATGEIVDNFILIAIEKEPPYIVAYYPLSQDVIMCGYKKFKEALYGIKKCTLENDWPGYEAKTMFMPNWGML